MDRKKLNLLMWPFALLLLNSLWVAISDNAAPHEINDFEHDIEERTITLAGVFGQDKPMPSVFEVEFKGLSVDEGAVEWKIFDNKNQIVAQWAGDLSDEDAGWEGELEPGTYRFQTTADSGIITKQILYIQPFSSYAFEGHLALSMMLFIVAFAETFVRKKGGEYLAKKNTKNAQVTEKAPFSQKKPGMPEYDDLPPEDDPWRTPKGL